MWAADLQVGRTNAEQTRQPCFALFPFAHHVPSFPSGAKLRHLLPFAKRGATSNIFSRNVHLAMIVMFVNLNFSRCVDRKKKKNELNYNEFENNYLGITCSSQDIFGSPSLDPFVH